MITLGLLAVSALLQVGSPPARSDSTVVLAPGDTVLVLNSFVHQGAIGPTAGRRLDIIYATRIPANDAASRIAQADRAAQIFGPRAIEIGARRLSIGICDTQACAQRQHPPAAWYLYERSADGWRRMK